jgi:hypothetical protein
MQAWWIVFCVSRHDVAPNVWSRCSYKAFRTEYISLRISAFSNPLRMRASISVSRSSIVRQRNPCRRRSRCRRIRLAAVDGRRSPSSSSFVISASRFFALIWVFPVIHSSAKQQHKRHVGAAFHTAVSNHSANGKITYPRFSTVRT